MTSSAAYKSVARAIHSLLISENRPGNAQIDRIAVKTERPLGYKFM